MAADLVAPSVSADGRYVAFSSYGRLVDLDANDRSDIYVLDRHSGVVTLETASTHDGPARDNIFPRISGDGHFVVYDTTEEQQGQIRSVISLRDRWRQSTIVLHGADVPNGASRSPAISADGRIVVFASCATNLVAGRDANGAGEDVYTYDTSSGKFQRVSLTNAGDQPVTGDSFAPAVSADGRFVVFTSTSMLDAGTSGPDAPTVGAFNVYERDTRLNRTTRIGRARGGAIPNGRSYEGAVSGNGRYVAFVSDASNLVRQDANGLPDVYLYDVESNVTTFVSRNVFGGSANGRSFRPAISGDGNMIAFQSEASDLTDGSGCGGKDINLVSDVFLFDRVNGITRCISGGRQRWMEPSAAPAIDGMGAVVAFSSRHPIDSSDMDNDFDLFIWTDATPIASRMKSRNR